MAYDKPSASGYNTNPPPDNGTAGADNEITWAKHKSKLGDPLKTYIDAINDEISSTQLAGEMQYYPPLSGETGVVNYEYEWGNVLRYGAVAYDTKAEAEAGTDSSSEIQAAWTYGRNNDVAIFFPYNKYFRTTAILKTQIDGSYAKNDIYGNDSTIVKDYAGVGVEVLGGAKFQFIEKLKVSASSSFEATDFEGSLASNVITPTYAEHGFHVVNTRAQLIGCHSELNRGAGLRIESTSTNSNKSEYDMTTANNGMAGVYISGSDDNLSVINANFQIQSEFGPAFHVENDVNFRSWIMRLYAESCVAGASAVSSGVVDQVYIGKSLACVLNIYSENTNASVQEIRMGVNTAKTIINSDRANKDNDDGTDKSNLWEAGHRVQGHGSSAVLRKYLAQNVTVANAKYMDIEYVGASSKLLFRQRIRGDGDVELHAFDTTGGEVTGWDLNANSDWLRGFTNDVEVVRFDKSSTAGETRFLIYDVDSGQIERVKVGANGSGSLANHRMLQIPDV